MSLNQSYLLMNFWRKMLLWRQFFTRSDFCRRNEVVYKIRVLLDKVFANRKITAGILIILVLLLYFGPSWFYGRRSFKKGSSYSCLLEYSNRNFDLRERDLLKQYLDGQSDVLKKFAPYTANGYFGLNVEDRRQPSLYLAHDGSISLPVPIDLQVDVVPQFGFSDESITTVLAIHKGTITKVAAYSVVGECVFVSSNFYAHRTIPELLVQEIKIDNPTLSSLVVNLKNVLMEDTLVPMLKDTENFQIKSTKVTMQNSIDHYRLNIGRDKISSQLTANPSSQQSLTVTTYLKLSEMFKSEKASDEYIAKAGDVMLKLRVDKNHVFEEHLRAWRELWQRGFSISHSKAPNTLNSDTINATLYFLLCNTLDPSLQRGFDKEAIDRSKSLLYNSGQCFNFHNTLLYPSRLWPDLKTTKDVLDVSYRWKLTLDKRGCSSLVKSGVHGFQQAVMLSLGGLKFTKQHLEFGVDPRELHRDYHFAGLNYGPNVHLDIWILVGEDNKPKMFLQANNTSGRKLYACDAACLDEAQEVGSTRIEVPVKLTDPLTPILYVTDDQKHVQELRHSIHVKEIVEAPPHEHHVMAMHKHGHRLGGLPAIFWVALVLLLVSFHLFLFKLIYNEYCRDDGASSLTAPSRGAYLPLTTRTRYRM